MGYVRYQTAQMEKKTDLKPMLIVAGVVVHACPRKNARKVQIAIAEYAPTVSVRLRFALMEPRMEPRPIWIVVVRPALGVLQPPAASSHEIVRARSVRTASVKTRPVMTMS